MTTIQQMKDAVNSAAVTMTNAAEYLRKQELEIETADLDGSLCLFRAIDMLEDAHTFCTRMWTTLYDMELM